ncbi:MAG TPA: helix-turn-helix domain-containing protein [Thermoanaerobaculia bacterium]|nr:helix-turn-helix domain-containing protein [Thermoanaerobaculia bacterium]
MMLLLGLPPGMLPLDPTVGIAVRAARHEAGLSQQRLAQLAFVSVRHVVDIEAGANFTVAVLFALARELPTLRIDDLLRGQAASYRPDPSPASSDGH